MTCTCESCETTAALFPAPKGPTANDRRLGRTNTTPDEIAAIWTALGDRWRAAVVRSAAVFPDYFPSDPACYEPLTKTARATLARPLPRWTP